MYGNRIVNQAMKEEEASYYEGGRYSPEGVGLDELYYNDPFVKAADVAVSQGNVVPVAVTQAAVAQVVAKSIGMGEQNHFEAAFINRLSRQHNRSTASRSSATPPPRSQSPATPTQSLGSLTSPGVPSPHRRSGFQRCNNPDFPKQGGVQQPMMQPGRCGTCKFPHVGVSKVCPHLASEVQLRVMLDSIRHETEPSAFRAALTAQLSLRSATVQSVVQL